MKLTLVSYLSLKINFLRENIHDNTQYKIFLTLKNEKWKALARPIIMTKFSNVSKKEQKSIIHFAKWESFHFGRENKTENFTTKKKSKTNNN